MAYPCKQNPDHVTSKPDTLCRLCHRLLIESSSWSNDRRRDGEESDDDSDDPSGPAQHHKSGADSKDKTGGKGTTGKAGKTEGSVATKKTTDKTQGQKKKDHSADTPEESPFTSNDDGKLKLLFSEKRQDSVLAQANVSGVELTSPSKQGTELKLGLAVPVKERLQQDVRRSEEMKRRSESNE